MTNRRLSAARPRLALMTAVSMIVVLMIVVLAASPMRAAVDALDAQTRSEVQGVITRQLDAFAHDDGDAAEALAAPGVKDKFPASDQFMAMVKSNYAALIRPRSTQFTGTADSPHGPLQEMTVVAADGTVWAAVYSFQKVDGAWRISGCVLRKDETQQAI